MGPSGASKRRVTAVGDLLQGDSLPLSKLGPVTQSSTMHTEPRGMVTDTPISDASPGKRALLAPHKHSYSRWRCRGGGSQSKLSL
jgi:hypothetical protein